MPKLCNNMYNNYYGEEFDYYYPYSFHGEDMSYLFSVNPCKVEIPFGNTYQVPIKLDTYIKVNENDLIYYIYGQCPDRETAAEIGTRAYNVVSLESWELKSIVDSVYYWEMDEVFNFPEDGTKIVELPEEFYIRNTASISIYNFRYELIYNIEQEAHKEFYFDITLDIAEEYFNFKGLYFLQVDLISLDGKRKDTVILPNTFSIAII